MSDGEGDKDSDGSPRARRRRYETINVSNKRSIIIKWDLGERESIGTDGSYRILKQKRDERAGMRSSVAGYQ